MAGVSPRVGEQFCLAKGVGHGVLGVVHGFLILSDLSPGSFNRTTETVVPTGRPPSRLACCAGTLRRVSHHEGDFCLARNVRATHRRKRLVSSKPP